MTIAATARFKRGGTISLALRVDSGDVTGATCRAVLKSAVYGAEPGDAAADAAVFDVAYVANIDPDDGASPPAWLLTISATVSAALAAGTYVADARIVRTSDVIQTATVRVILDERVTEAA